MTGQLLVPGYCKGFVIKFNLRFWEHVENQEEDLREDGC